MGVVCGSELGETDIPEMPFDICINGIFYIMSFFNIANIAS